MYELLDAEDPLLQDMRSWAGDDAGEPAGGK
jgi:hypothetical protein